MVIEYLIIFLNNHRIRVSGGAQLSLGNTDSSCLSFYNEAPY